MDELGVGIVRDSISDLLYPGTSVLHTRAKYYILVPELFKKAMKSGLTTGSEVRRLIDSDQDAIARALRRAIDEETGTKAAGIIGGRSDRAVKMKPTRIYWNALRTTGILCNPSLSYDDACSAVASYNKKKQNIELKTESDDEGGDALDALSGSNMFVLSKDGAECLVRLEVEDMPSEERDDAIFNEIISNKPMFMTYMRYLLDEDFYDSVSFEELIINGKGAGEGSEGYGFTVEPDVYEKMLKAAADYPERFDSMYEVVERLDDNKIGEEFKQLLELFMKAAGRKGKGRK